MPIVSAVVDGPIWDLVEVGFGQTMPLWKSILATNDYRKSGEFVAGEFDLWLCIAQCQCSTFAFLSHGYLEVHHSADTLPHDVDF